MQEHKSCFNTQVVEFDAYLHNHRILEPDYLITAPNFSKMKMSVHGTHSLEKLHNIIKADYEKHQGQKMQKSSQPLQEASINVKSDTTIQDLYALQKRLNEEFGIETIDLSLHKDEGHFEITDEKTGYVYKVDRKYNKQLRDLEDGSTATVKIKLEDEEVEIKGKIERKFNYHAHMIYSKYDFENHKNIRLSKIDMQKIQDITAEVLKMERGQKFSKKKRQNHHQQAYNSTYQNNNAEIEITKNIKLKVKDVKRFFQFNRELAKQIGQYSQKDYQELNALSRQITDKVKTKQYNTVQELHNDLTKIIRTNIKEHYTRNFQNKVNGVKMDKQEFLDFEKKVLNSLNDFLSDVIELKEVEKLKEDLKIKDEQIQELTIENSDLKNRHLDVDHQIKKKDDQIANLENQISDKNIQAQRNITQMKVKDELIKGYKFKIENLEIESNNKDSNLQAQVNHLKKELELKAQNEKQLETKIENLEKVIEELLDGGLEGSTNNSSFFEKLKEKESKDTVDMIYEILDTIEEKKQSKSHHRFR